MQVLSLLRFSFCAASPLATAALTPGPEFIRLNKNDSMVVVADLQDGLFQTVRDFEPTTFKNNIIAHAAIANLFHIPIVLTTSAETGPNGPLPKEIISMYPDAPLIRRNGEVDAWDNADFRAAVRAQNKTQIILAGITTDVCMSPNPPIFQKYSTMLNILIHVDVGTEYLALSLRAEGYTVFANTEASGTFSRTLAADANRRMENAGVVLMGMFSVVMDLMRDWRNTPGSAQLLPFLDQYLPAYGFIARAHEAAVLNGSLVPGEKGL